MKAINVGIAMVKKSWEYHFNEWLDIPFPNTYNNTNCYIFYAYLDSDIDKYIFLKFNPSYTKYLLQTKVDNDRTWTIVFLFIKL